MCGIAGAIVVHGSAADDEFPQEVVRRMARLLAHRGPDGAGTWTSPDGDVCLGHRRLAIVDLTARGEQPMKSRDGRYCVTFNGEIYNFRELADELRCLGHEFSSTGDTEVLLAAIGEWGLRRALMKFIGMFAFALWDQHEKVVHLVRDRMGEKPLHFGVINRCLYFASELRAFRAISGFDGGVDQASVAAFLRFGYVPEPFSIVEGVFKLPPGTVLSVPTAQPFTGIAHPRSWNGSRVGGEVAPLSYWSCLDAARASAANRIAQPADAMYELEQKLRASIRRQLLCDVPVGCFLSGGIDSSLVAAVAQRESSQPIRTFTVSFGRPEFDESQRAREIARCLGTHHQQLDLSDGDLVASVPDAVWALDEPTANGSFFAAHAISRLARDHVAVVLSGDGGDELFAGYNRYRLAQKVWRLAKAVPRSVRRDVAGALNKGNSATLSGLITKLVSVGSQVSKRSLHDKLIRVLMAEDFSQCYDFVTSCWPPYDRLSRGAIRERVWYELPGISSMLLSDQLDYLPGDSLAKLDRASMTASLETRLPLLDHQLVEFSWTVPDEMKLSKDGEAKWLMRSVLKRLLPSGLMDSVKMGFTVPVDLWMRGPLRSWANDMLNGDAFRNTMGDKYSIAVGAWEGFQSGKSVSSYQTWALVVLAAWCEEHQQKRMR